LRSIYILFISLIFFSCSNENTEKQIQKKEIILEKSYNEIFEYQLIGMDSKIVKKSGNTANLLIEYPYLFTPNQNIIPPEFILNKILSIGKVDAGMSGQIIWSPYRLKKGDFKLLIHELNKISKYGKLIYKEPDLWVKTFDDWNIWVLYIKKGIPWKEHKRLNDIVISLEKEQQIAKKQNDFDKINELHIKLIKASNELRDFMMKYI